MASDEDRKQAMFEALSLCGDVFLACKSAQVPMEEFNKWNNADHLFRLGVEAAQAEGKTLKERVASMRKVVEKHDETIAILQRKADEFRKFEEVRRKEAQTTLL
jgi:hypothetical protein